MNVRVEKKEGCVKTRNGIHMNPLSYDSNRFISDQEEISPYPPSFSSSIDLKVTATDKENGNRNENNDENDDYDTLD